MSAASSTLRAVGGAVRNRVQFVLGQLGFAQSDERLTADAARYWTGDRDDRWRNDSHWVGGSRFEDTDRWAAVGREHLALFQRLRAGTGAGPQVERIVDWGCGGGANAVAFAPLAEEFIGVDVVPETLDECARRVAARCSTRFLPVLVDVARPQDGADGIPRPCDLFLCLYVLELVPTPAYGLQIMRIAYGLLGPGGQAFVQIKYATASWRTRPRRRAYRSAVAGTTYRIEEFWTATTRIGFRPEVVVLVPENDLDERYAYFLLTRP